ncbi:hypothetical protein TTRE_0000817101 [Trichuris trichiura]|uniref:Uncharacterized protein n=1 Tax=Trichuris trichiura TaxID=36087 RepID=A0A077ZMD9_TRITR|nr:hypothetical protein TTRE_0000817101 [Trichuris trichiura]
MVKAPQFRVWRPLTYGQRKARFLGYAVSSGVTAVFCILGILTYHFAFPTPAMRYSALASSFNIDTSENLYKEDKVKRRLRLFGDFYEDVEDMRAGAVDTLGPLRRF